jgi:hypothetical protein
MAIGLVILVTGLAFAASPFRDAHGFHRAIGCETTCFASEDGHILSKRTYTTTRTYTDGNGNGITQTETTTHWELSWERPGGRRESRDVSATVYDHAEPNAPARLRTWHGAVIGIEVMGATQWFLPPSGESLGGWLSVTWFGLGVLLWGLVIGYWDGLFMLAFRTMGWMFIAIMPIQGLTRALTYGLPSGGDLAWSLVFGVFFTGIAVSIVLSSLDGFPFGPAWRRRLKGWR